MKQNTAAAATPVKDTGIINLVLLVSLLAVLILPLYTIFFLTPAFTRFIIADTEKRLTSVASRMADTLMEKENSITAASITPGFIRELEHIRAVIAFPKAKVFAVDSTIIFSTDPADIGRKSQQTFFQDIVATGRANSYISKKEMPDKSGATSSRLIIETYVPIIHGTRTIGVFEIYYDITETSKALERLTHRAYVVLLCIVLVLLGAVLLSVAKSRSNMRARNLAEMEIRRQKELLEQQNEELARLHERAQALSLQDHLTGLGNRRLLEINFERALSLAHRYGKVFSLIMLDIDLFKDYNDTHGHQAGDRVLAAIAALIRGQLRETDFAFRYGGEEFLLLLPESSQEKALIVAEKLRLAVAAGTEVTISLGATTYRNSTTNIEEMVREADEALYTAKRQGRNRVVGWLAADS